MDTTKTESILQAREEIEKKEGKLHILVNNAGQSGPKSSFLSDPSTPEQKNASTLGQALFDNESLEDWANLFTVDVSAMFFVSTAFLGLLAKGSEDVAGYWSSIINITSICGTTKLNQAHFCYNVCKAASSHLTRLVAAQIAQSDIPVRVNSIAPGVFESDMTAGKLHELGVDGVIGGVQPVPAKRAGGEQEMAGTALYLASRAGGYTTGQEIAVDGGYLAINP